MRIEQVPRVVARCRSILGKRNNAPFTLNWMEDHPYAVVSLVDAIDRVIDKLNVTTFLPEYARNAREVKSALGDKALYRLSTTIRTMQLKDCESGQEALLKLSEMMKRGETTKVEPYLSFHTKHMDYEARTVGGLFHFYEVACSSRFGESDIMFEDGQVTNALVELSTSKLLLDALGNPKRLDWIRDWDSFDPKFRQSAAGFPYQDPPTQFPIEPNRHFATRSACWPQKIVMALQTRKDMKVLAKTRSGMHKPLRVNALWLERHIALWRGVDNLDAWLSRYDPLAGRPLAETTTDWSFIGQGLRPKVNGHSARV